MRIDCPCNECKHNENGHCRCKHLRLGWKSGLVCKSFVLSNHSRMFLEKFRKLLDAVREES